MAAYTTIDDPTAYFQTKTYTGTGSSNAFTLDGNSNLQPDWVWIKHRAEAHNHYLYDSVRGVQLKVSSNTNAGEINMGSGSDAGLTAFGSNGFTIGGDTDENASSESYVAWNWKESATAGFDICSWTGNGSAQNISHNLSKVPTMIIVKNRTDSGADWYCYNVHIGNTHSILLNTSGAKVGAYSDNWNDTTPTSSVFTVGSSNSTGGSSSDNMIAYVFTDIQGYSKFGSYIGNGSTNGTYVHLGFKPSFFMAKRIDASDMPWVMIDNKRNSFNPLSNTLLANSNEAANTGTDRADFLSQGVKIRTNSTAWNASGASFIFMAFAENPFVTSSGVPACAR